MSFDNLTFKIDPELARRIVEGLRRSATAAIRLAQLGWTVPMWATPGQVVEILKSGEEATVDDRFVAIYSSGGGEVFQRLVRDLVSQPPLVKWHPLIHQCVEAYHREHFQITIPSLLTIIEGILAHSAADNGTRLIRLAHSKVAQLENDGPNRIIFVIWQTIETFVTELFAKAPFLGPRRQVINRHWILHGRDATTWTQADSLRLFQAIHTVSQVAFEDFREKIGENSNY